MRIHKWNYILEEYEDCYVPDAWNIATYRDDMDAKVNCACCGTEVAFGACYTSRTLHTERGMGYGVCRSCYEIECNEEQAYRKLRTGKQVKKR